VTENSTSVERRQTTNDESSLKQFWTPLPWCMSQSTIRILP